MTAPAQAGTDMPKVLMEVEHRSVCRWLGVWICLVCGLTVQSSLDLHLLTEEMDRSVRAEAALQAQLLATRVLSDRALANTELDEVLARPLVFDMMENRKIRACAVLTTERFLEAQVRQPDGSLVPLAGDFPSTVWTGQALLEDGQEILGKVLVELDHRPLELRLEHMRSKALWHLVFTSLGTGVLVLVLNVVFTLMGRRRARKPEPVQKLELRE